MDLEEMTRIVDGALLDGLIEAECVECGVNILCESDAVTAWCDNCNKLVKVRNFVREMGFI